MYLELYAIHDNKIEAFQPPLYQKNYSELMGLMMHYLKTKHKEINPVDYDVYYLGQYDLQTGVHILQDAPKHKMNLRALAETMKLDLNPDEEEKEIVQKLLDSLDQETLTKIIISVDKQDKKITELKVKQLEEEIQKAKE